MKITNYKQSKKEKVFEILDKQGYILDDQKAKIFGNSNIYKIYDYERIWKKLTSDRDYFKDLLIIEKKKGHRCHLVRTKDMNEGSYLKVGKEFYNEITIK